MEFEFDPVKLNNLYNIPGAKHNSKRRGRGIGSGKGKQCGRGTKGQNARSGVAIKHFEGGQMPMIARLPKRGFNPLKRFSYNVVDLNLINHLLEAKMIKPGSTIDKAYLSEIGIIKTENLPVKLLGKAKLSAKVNFHLDAYSEAAKAQVLEVGGEIK